MKIYLARHGQTEFNLHKILMGQRYDVDLDRIGTEQAHELAAKVQGQGIDVVFCSPLKRAKHTAEIVAQKLNIPLIEREELQERDYGNLSGKTWSEIEKETGVSLQHIEEHLNVDLGKFHDEKINMVKTRLMQLLADIKKDYSDKTPLLVTHSGIIRLMHIIYPRAKKLEVNNASLHEFEI